MKLIIEIDDIPTEWELIDGMDKSVKHVDLAEYKEKIAKYIFSIIAPSSIQKLSMRIVSNRDDCVEYKFIDGKLVPVTPR